MTEAWIGFAGGAIAVIVSALVALRQARVEERLARLNSDLETEVHRRSALFDRELQAEEVLTRYREPLAAAAFDLQSRLYNILELNFFDKFGGSHPRAEEAIRTTLFRLAQYFGWTEILRRDIQFLSFPEDDETRRVAELQSEVAKRFLTSDYGAELMIWADEQRAIGERMIVDEHGKVLCMGYARFRDACDNTFAPCVSGCEANCRSRPRNSACARQHLLCDLSRRSTRGACATRATSNGPNRRCRLG